MNRIILNFVVEIQHLTVTWELIENHLNHLPDQEGQGARERLKEVQKKLLNIVIELKTLINTLEFEKAVKEARMRTKSKSAIKTEPVTSGDSHLYDEVREVEANLFAAKRMRWNLMNYIINRTRHGWNDDILENTVSFISSTIMQ